MSAGYSGTPLVKKLGIRSGMRLLVRGCPRPYPEMVPDLPAGIELQERATEGIDIVHAFVTSSATLESSLRDYRALIRPAGAIWISWPKQAARVATDVSEAVIRAAALKTGLVDTKVCAVDEVWSGLKLVIPVASR